MVERSLRVNFFFLTDTVSSEHIYAQELQDSLIEHGIEITDDWQDADIIHLFEVNFFTSAAVSSFKFPTLLRILGSDVPVVVSLDDLYFIDRPDFTAHPRLYQFNKHAQRWLLNQVDGTIAISDSVRQNLLGTTDPDKIRTVYHGVRRAYFPDGSRPTDEGYVFHVSMASKRKNPEAIVELASRLNEPFLIAGSGWEEYIPRRLTRENVELLGYVSEEELIDYYQGASIFYFPTYHEGFGLPVLEAMAAETAVVTSDVYSVPEVAGETAILCCPDDVTAHLSNIERLLANTDERHDLARQARARAESFTWEKAARKTEEIYRELLPPERTGTSTTR